MDGSHQVTPRWLSRLSLPASFEAASTQKNVPTHTPGGHGKKRHAFLGGS